MAINEKKTFRPNQENPDTVPAGEFDAPEGRPTETETAKSPTEILPEQKTEAVSNATAAATPKQEQSLTTGEKHPLDALARSTGDPEHLERLNAEEATEDSNALSELTESLMK